MEDVVSGRRDTDRSFTYDSQERAIEVRDRNFIWDSVATISYNEHGDKSEERVTRQNTER